MVDIPMRSSAPVTRQTVLSINERKVEGAKTTRTITSINHTQSQTASKASSGTTSSMQHTAMHPSAMHPSAMHPASTPASKPLPPLVHMVQKGQKTPLENSGKLTSIKACLGWNVKNPACDVDVSLEKNRNFGMLQDAYIRIMDSAGAELVSFKMDEYYSNVTSMMIGELYLHNGAWKFNAIGNGVAKDLAGLCEMYGVQVI